MRRGAKPAKAKADAKLPVARQSRKNEGSSNRQLEKRLAEALEQQKATGEILRVISTSPMDLQPVLDAVVRSAARFCGAYDAAIFRLDGGGLRLTAHHGPIPSPGLIPVVPGTVVGRSVHEGRAVHVVDLQAEPEQFPEGTAFAREFGHRTALSVPLLREGRVMGAINLRRAEVNPFTDKQIALLEIFADQAVIAIENVRLFQELQARNRELTDALEQQTATSQVLGVISSSPTNLEPVYEAILASIMRLCEANIAALFLYDGEVVRAAASQGTTPEFAEHLARSRAKPSHQTTTRLAARDRRVVHVADLLAEPTFSPQPLDLYRRENVRTVLSVPLLRENNLVGVITTWRREVRPFSDPQIALVRTFADQAVIAIENVRLFKELQARNREIEDKSRQLEAASRHKSEFLANMSHELRTPLNAVIGFSEVLTERMFGELNEKQDEYLKDIYASGQHLLSLINDILDLSKIEAGRMELEPTDFDLPAAIDNALTLVRERAGRRGITLRCEIDDRVGMIRGDERKVKQVLLNLLSNALKFTPEGGRIDVRTALNDALVEVSVADTGVGIAPEDQEAVFEEFRQVGTADKKVEGTGLGLALSRKFIELHGGKIWVKSQVGQGSTFTFTIPGRRGE